MDDDGADVELLVAEGLCGGADVVLAQTDLQNVADRPDEGKAEIGWLLISYKGLVVGLLFMVNFHPSIPHSLSPQNKATN